MKCNQYGEIYFSFLCTQGRWFNINHIFHSFPEFKNEMLGLKIISRENQLNPGSKSVGVGVILKRVYSFLCKENAKDDS